MSAGNAFQTLPALDDGDWLCLQCGTYYYTRLYRTPVPLPDSLPGTESRIEDGNEDRRVKAVSLLTYGGQGLSQYLDLPAAAFAFGGTTAIEPRGLGLVAGSMPRYERR